MGSLTIENRTHWRSKDILGIVRACLTRVDLGDLDWRVYASYESGKGVSARLVIGQAIIIHLPKEGPRMHVLEQLAAAAVNTKTKILHPDASNYLANLLVALLYNSQRAENYGDPEEFKQERSEANSRVNSVTAPDWLGERYIHKFADPTKDARHVAHVEKVEKAIKTAQNQVDHWEAEEIKARTKARSARSALKKHQRRLRDAKKRAAERRFTMNEED